MLFIILELVSYVYSTAETATRMHTHTACVDTPPPSQFLIPLLLHRCNYYRENVTVHNCVS